MIKHKQKAVIFFAIVLFVSLGIVLFFSISVYLQKNRTNENISEIESYVETAPSNEQSQVEWAKVNATNLKKSGLAKSSNKEQLSKYYSNLFMYYMMSNNIEEAAKDYEKDSSKVAVFLEPQQLGWLAGYYASKENYAKASDLMSLQIDKAEYNIANQKLDSQEKQQMQSSIERLKSLKQIYDNKK